MSTFAVEIMTQKIAIFILLAGSMTIAHGQILKSELNRRVDVGEEMMLGGSYDSADMQFTVVLKNLKPLPAKMAYFYGRNSYHLGKHKRAINWLNKYIQLTGARGIHYEETVEYLGLAEAAFIKERQTNAQAVSDELANVEFDCGGLEKMLCPVCGGTGVVLEQGTFEPVYKTCPYSLGEGFLSCDDYNLFMKGLLEPKPEE